MTASGLASQSRLYLELLDVVLSHPAINVNQTTYYYGQTECVRVLARTGKVDWNVRDMSGTSVQFTLHRIL